MRLAGVALLIIGFLLCVSIAWAAIGFFAMGFGLICLLIASSRKNAMPLRKESSTARLAPFASLQIKPTNDPAATNDNRHEIDLREYESAPRELVDWNSLVASDEELSQVVDILTPLGQKYVDQLRTTYVIFNIRAYLPTILNMIVGSAQRDAGLLPADDRRTNSYYGSTAALQRIFPRGDFDVEPAKNAIDAVTWDIAVPADGTEPTPTASLSTPALSNAASDELDDLKKLLDKIDLPSSKHL